MKRFKKNKNKQKALIHTYQIWCRLLFTCPLFSALVFSVFLCRIQRLPSHLSSVCCSVHRGWGHRCRSESSTHLVYLLIYYKITQRWTVCLIMWSTTCLIRMSCPSTSLSTTLLKFWINISAEW